jgi:hypothetical protein
MGWSSAPCVAQAMLCRCAAAGEGEDNRLVMRDLVRDESQFLMLVQAVRILIRRQQHREAKEIAEACMQLLARRACTAGLLGMQRSTRGLGCCCAVGSGRCTTACSEGLVCMRVRVRTRAADSLVSCPPSRRRWVDKSKRDVLRMLLAEAALAQRDYAEALQHIKPVCTRWPHSVLAWNSFCRCFFWVFFTKTLYKTSI